MASQLDNPVAEGLAGVLDDPDDSGGGGRLGFVHKLRSKPLGLGVTREVYHLDASGMQALRIGSDFLAGHKT